MQMYTQIAFYSPKLLIVPHNHSLSLTYSHTHTLPSLSLTLSLSLSLSLSLGMWVPMAGLMCSELFPRKC